MPILEGLDGVQKMSKSLGNAIGIQEPPLEMYGKVMSISDEMMWRYYELLTDVTTADIEKSKGDVAAGQAHPMNVKKELARRIVSDFHSPEAARKAAEDWAKQFQKDEAPDAVEEVPVEYAEVQWTGAEAADGKLWIRLDRLLVKVGLADSATDAARKVKQNAVRVEDKVETDPHIAVLCLPSKLRLRVGRKIKIAAISL
jgi:tyrosyl-tRNA synthetase